MKTVDCMRPAGGMGWWRSGPNGTCAGLDALPEALRHVHEPFCLLDNEDTYRVAVGGAVSFGAEPIEGDMPVAAYVPACPIERLGDAGFCADYGVRYPYICGSMAHGIASTAIAEALGKAGMLGFFGAAGLEPAAVETAIDRLSALGKDIPYGINLIHSPNETGLEDAIVDLFLRRGIRLVEASAFLRLTLPVIRYRVHGIHRDASGTIVTPNRLIAKVSRVELAERFFAPAPDNLLQQLVAKGTITAEQAELAARIPVAQDITAEADSGGHTDNRPAIALLPTICAVRDRLQEQYRYSMPLRVGLGGGIGTPVSAAAAFAMGAAYVLTGTINQSCVESGTSDAVRTMLGAAEQADVAMAPAADMFEMGVTVQVLKRGTMFSMRAAKLYELYRKYNAIEEIPTEDRTKIEKTMFRLTLDQVWDQTRAFFAARDPRQLERAEKNPRQKMALVFRWYLGQASHWATRGEAGREVDYQVWCGPAMGAFNEWVKGTFLEPWTNRDVVTVALNILHGAAVVMRLSQLRQQGIALPPAMQHVVPLERAQIEEYLR